MGRAGGQRGMGCKMRREGRGGLEEEATVREAVPRHGTAVRRAEGGGEFSGRKVGPGCAITGEDRY